MEMKVADKLKRLGITVEQDIEKKVKTYNKLMACTDTGTDKSAEELGILTALEDSYDKMLEAAKNIEKTKRTDYAQNG